MKAMYKISPSGVCHFNSTSHCPLQGGPKTAVLQYLQETLLKKPYKIDGLSSILVEVQLPGLLLIGRAAASSMSLLIPVTTILFVIAMQATAAWSHTESTGVPFNAARLDDPFEGNSVTAQNTKVMPICSCHSVPYSTVLLVHLIFLVNRKETAVVADLITGRNLYGIRSALPGGSTDKYKCFY